MYRLLDHPLLHRLRGQVLFSAGPIGSTLLSYNLKADAFVAADGEEHDGCPERPQRSAPTSSRSSIARSTKSASMPLIRARSARTKSCSPNSGSPTAPAN